MSLEESKRKELEELLADLEMGNLDAPAKVRLNAIISQSSEARRIYLDHCQMQALLRESSLLAAFREEESYILKSKGVALRRSASVWIGLAAAACVIFFVGTLAPHFIPDKAYGSERSPLATVSKISGSSRLGKSPLSLGSEVRKGVLQVDSGSISLRFNHGSDLLIEGPSKLSIDSGMQVTLVEGKVAARITEDGQGFTILGPDSAVVDLGTEFAMAVEGGQGYVEVYDGEVDIALLNGDGHAWKSRLLSPSGPVQIDPDSGEITDAKPSMKLPRIEDPPPVGLAVPEEYVSLVMESAPDHFWRFEEASQGASKDVVAGLAAQLEGGTDFNQGGLYFPPGKKNHGSVRINAVDPGSFAGEFTLEAWVNPTFIQKRVLIGVEFSGDDEREPVELFQVSLMPQAVRTVYPAETFRFSANLQPYGEQGEVSAFSSQHYAAGEWQHLVVVRHRDRFEVYLNGIASQSTPLPSLADDNLPVSIYFGRGGVPRRPDMKTDRLFYKGQLDEVALYSRALSSEEIAAHYRLIQE